MNKIKRVVQKIAHINPIYLATLIAIVTYALSVWAVLSLFGRSFSDYWATSQFWFVLLFVILFTIVRTKWPWQTSKYTMIFVCITLVAIGLTLVFLSGVKSIWVNPPWDPSILGTGVSIAALGVSLAVAFWPPRIPIPDKIPNPETEVRESPNPNAGRINTKFWYDSKSPLLIGSLISIILLVLFMVLQYISPTSLVLDVKWIIVSGIPLLVALIVGGYIKGFKGFGIELEMRFQEPIISLDLEASHVYVSTEGLRKQTLEDLDRISVERKRKITRLQFISSRRDYYDLNVVYQYMRELPNLEYFEVVKRGGTFMCLLPINLFNNRQNNDELSRFVETLEEGRILLTYDDQAITFTVNQDQSIIEVLETLRDHTLESAVVLDNRRKVLGLIKTSDIERRIATEVLFQTKRKNKK